MSTKTFTEMKPVVRIDSITCDRCNKTYDMHPNSSDVFEVQEFHRIDFTGGFRSVFGDGSVVQCDLCQSCLKELISDFCYINGMTEEQYQNSIGSNNEYHNRADGMVRKTAEDKQP